MSDFYIDIAKDFDATNACKVLRKSIEEVCKLDYLDLPHSFIDTWLENKTPQNIKLWIEKDSNIFLLAKTNIDKIVGVASISKEGKILLCYILPEYLNQGIGRALLDKMTDLAIDWRLSKIYAYSTRTAKEFYLKNGFIDLEEYEFEDDKIIEYKVEKYLKKTQKILA